MYKFTTLYIEEWQETQKSPLFFYWQHDIIASTEARLLRYIGATLFFWYKYICSVYTNIHIKKP